jgi:23S rRNA (guanine745-N1)-methyltransferase
VIPLLCPLDGLPLVTTERVARCSGNHAFDWAKEGYLNLLPVHAKQSKDPGDSIEMIQARRRFLSAGYYDGIINAIISLLPGQDHLALLDAGCGEGTYLNKIHIAVPQADLYGLDISKHAVRAAAKINPQITWLVASNRQLPFPADSFDVILCAFGFPVWHEFIRVLKKDGIIIMVDPARDHLLELRQALYPDVKQKDPDFTAPDGLTLHAEHRVTGQISLTAPAMIRDLIAMTPHQHRVPQTIIDQASQTGFPTLTYDVVLRILKV